MVRPAEDPELGREIVRLLRRLDDLSAPSADEQGLLAYQRSKVDVLERIAAQSRGDALAASTALRAREALAAMEGGE